MSSTPGIVWLQQDLRLADQPALAAAVARGGPVVPVFIWSPDEEGAWAPGSASRWWLHQSLLALQVELDRRGSQLVIRRGPTMATLRTLVRETGAGAVYWNDRYEPAAINRESRVAAELRKLGVEAVGFDGSLLGNVAELRTTQDRPYQVFTPFWKGWKLTDVSKPLAAPRKLVAPKRWPRSETLASLKLEPAIDWAGGMQAAWTPGERGAQTRLRAFLHRGVAGYPLGRDRPDLDGVSHLSPYLHFGELSPRQLWHAVRDWSESQESPKLKAAGEAFLRQIGWREFAHHLLINFPHTTDEPLRESFARFAWVKDKAGLRAWQRGQTGYPIVDAGMRQLWTTGWMHNRVRMIVASFLVKDLRIHWLSGARWFWDTLVDADLANNTLGWQWTAGCGADAAPYFRVFNPVSQGKKFDPEGDYVRRWVPELSRLPKRWIHAPWEAPADVLAAASVSLGKTYPRPIVDHAEARRSALKAWASLKRR